MSAVIVFLGLAGANGLVLYEANKRSSKRDPNQPFKSAYGLKGRYE